MTEFGRAQVGINVTLKQGLAPSPQELPAFDWLKSHSSPFFQRGWNRIATSRCRISKQQLFTSNNQFSNRTSKREDGGLDKHPNMGSWRRRRNLGKGKGIKSANGQIRMDQTYPTARGWISSWQLDSILEYCTAKGMCQGDGQTNGSCLVEVDG